MPGAAAADLAEADLSEADVTGIDLAGSRPTLLALAFFAALFFEVLRGAGCRIFVNLDDVRHAGHIVPRAYAQVFGNL